MLFPRGSGGAVVTDEVGGGYISANAPNPEACYRWLRVVAAQPDLFWSLSERKSLSKTSSRLSDETFYQALDTVLKRNDTIVFSPEGDYYLEQWLYGAFDQYVLKGADLEAALNDAEAYTKAYQACMADVPLNLDRPVDDQQSQSCAEKIDARLRACGSH